MHDSAWDLSWVDRLKDVPYRVVFDANDVADGFALDLAVMFLDQYHEVYGTRDDQARAVIVMRQLGTPLALGDALWDRYAIGEEIKVKDPATHQPARRNPFLRAAPGVSPDVAKLGGGTGKGLLIVDDLVDTGTTGRLVRQLLPDAHFATVYAKPKGKPLVDTFITEVSQDTWIHFPWDTALSFQPPIRP